MGFGATAEAQKMKAEDVVAKSIDAIGTAESRAKMVNVTAAGEVIYSQRSGIASPAPGKVVIASEANKLLLALTFASSVYQLEKIAFDGKNLRVAFSTPGIRSTFGDFMWRYDGLIKEGLFGGVLGKGWSLNDLALHNARLSFDGEKKIDGKEVYVIGYVPKKGSDISIKLYFDKETFRHVRTEYFRSISALMASTPEASAGQTDNHENLIEDFSDFKTELGVTLPRTYKLGLHTERGKNTYEYYYTFTLKDFYYNSKFDPSTFLGDAK